MSPEAHPRSRRVVLAEPDNEPQRLLRWPHDDDDDDDDGDPLIPLLLLGHFGSREKERERERERDRG